MVFNPFEYLEGSKKLFTPINKKASAFQKAIEKLQRYLGEYEILGKLRGAWEDMTAAMYFNPIEAHKMLKNLEPSVRELAENAKDKDVRKIANSLKNVIGPYIRKMKEIANYIVERGKAAIYQQEKKIREASEKINEEQARISQFLGYKFE